MFQIMAQSKRDPSLGSTRRLNTGELWLIVFKSHRGNVKTGIRDSPELTSLFQAEP